MKKLVNIIAIAVIGMGVTFAQIPAAKKATPAKSAAPVVVKKTETKVVTVKSTAPAAAKKAATVATPTKADGTPDMRYKVNKETKTVVAGPKKKDGTADMRYKANKATAPNN